MNELCTEHVHACTLMCEWLTPVTMPCVLGRALEGGRYQGVGELPPIVHQVSQSYYMQFICENGQILTQVMGCQRSSLPNPNP